MEMGLRALRGCFQAVQAIGHCSSSAVEYMRRPGRQPHSVPCEGVNGAWTIPIEYGRGGRRCKASKKAVPIKPLVTNSGETHAWLATHRDDPTQTR
jgi:hypothetical protein